MDLFCDKSPEANKAMSDFFASKLADMPVVMHFPKNAPGVEASLTDPLEAYEVFEGIDQWAIEIQAANKAKGFDTWGEINSIINKWAIAVEATDPTINIVPYLDALVESLHPIIEPMRRARMIALIHSELSEMLEADRKDLMDSHLPDRKGWEVEGADVFIRLLDCLASTGHADSDQRTIGKTIGRKLEYNARRPHKHGKKY